MGTKFSNSQGINIANLNRLRRVTRVAFRKHMYLLGEKIEDVANPLPLYLPLFFPMLLDINIFLIWAAVRADLLNAKRVCFFLYLWLNISLLSAITLSLPPRAVCL
ncbi:hypothetical protein TcG_02043 [Trypanosoma cruzi]|nr:hypothetical protein TcG_02043 [Trypanosoma cruzi]